MSREIRDYEVKKIEMDREQLIRQIEVARLRISSPYIGDYTEFIIGNTSFTVSFPNDLQSE